MPEGHTIHRLARDLARDLAGQVVEASSPQGRFTEADRLDGRKLRGTEAIGKHLLLDFGDGWIVHVHLGLFGRFRRMRNPAPPPRDTTRLRLVGPSSSWDLVGPTACEVPSAAGLRALRARLGADPLARRADPGRAWQAMQRSRRAIGAVLLDQSVFAGIGNVYRAELLFLVGLHPETPARDVPREAFDDLWSLARDLLRRGVEQRRIVTVDHPPGARPPRGESLWVYKQERCRTCRGSITRITSAARSLWLCETCQPRVRTEPRTAGLARGTLAAEARPRTAAARLAARTAPARARSKTGRGKTVPAKPRPAPRPRRTRLSS